MTDDEGVMMYVNDNFEKKLGYRRDELIGKHHSLLNSGLHPKSYYRHIWSEIGASRIWRGNICNKTKDGARVWMDTTITPVDTKTGQRVHIVVRTDISGLMESHQRERYRTANEKCINALLATAFNASDLTSALEFAIDNLLTAKWLKIEKKAGIFLYSEDTGLLNLAAQRNLGDEIKAACATVKCGHCLCGRAAQTRELQFASCVDDRHEIRYPGMQPHGHYNVPVLFDGKLLAVLVVYLEHGFKRDEPCETFLKEYAEIIAILIDTKRNSHELVRKTKLLQAIIENIDDGISFYNTDMKVELFNSRFLNLLELAEDQFDFNDPVESFFRRSAELGDFGDGDVEDIVSQRLEALKAGLATRFEVTRKNGTILDIVREPVDGLGVVTTYKDVTERAKTANKLIESKNTLEKRVHQLETLKSRLEEKSSEAVRFAEELRQAKDIQFDALNNMTEGFALWDSDDRLLMCNQMYANIYAGMKDVIQPGIQYEAFIREACKRGVIAAPSDEAEKEASIRERMKSHRNSVIARDEQLCDGRWVRISERAASDGRIVGVITDITEQRISEEAIKRLAETDPLTGLPNRSLFYQRLETALKQGERSGCDVGVMLLDLDDFKDINDTLGHPVGDALLSEVAERILDCARETDTVARLGSDEFAVIATNLSQQLDVDFLAGRIAEIVSRPFKLNGQVVHTTASIGITVFPQDYGDPNELMRNADIALYQAKAHGRGTYKLFDDRMNAEIQTRRAVEADLRRALTTDELTLYLQPQIAVPSGRIVGMEALIRWHHPEYGLIPPDKFIPVAEATRLIIELGDWILRTACKMTKDLQNRGLRQLEMAVNISPLQFKQNDFLDQLRNALDESGLEPQWLELEITESMAMNEDVTTLFSDLKEIGVKRAIDDFGTGYSSLSRLKNFPVDRLKIDRSFVRDLDTQSDHLAISKAIIQLGHSLNLKVIAEGVETLGEMESLIALGCDQAQDYLYAPALPENEFAEFVRIHEPTLPQRSGDRHALASVS